MKLTLIKTPQGSFIPASDEDADKSKRFKVGRSVSGEFAQMRNDKFHRKLFAMLKVGFDAFDPAESEYKGLPVVKNPERFRKDCIIAAGFYTYVSDINGNVKAEADSISFANMDDEEFERVYNAVATVLLHRILKNYTRNDLDAVVERMIGFI